MRSHWVIYLLLCCSATAATRIANGQTLRRSGFCFSYVKECAYCPKVNASNESPSVSLFFKGALDDPALNRCVTLDSDKSRLLLPGRTPVSLKSREDIDDRQSPTPQPAPDDQDLAKKLSNPVASLISVPFQQNFDFGMGAGSGWRSTLNLQPVIPISLTPKWNLISRTILPVIHQHNVVPNSSQTGLGDITQSLFFSPTDSTRFIWGVGPALLIPTATDENLGTEKFGVGPTLLVLKQKQAWTYGALVNHIWSVAGSDTRSDVNNTFLQPFLAYNTRDAWTFGLNAESSYDWVGNHWNVPIHFTVTKLIKVGKQPISIGGALRCWAASSPGGPENCGLRFIFTPLFPK